MARYKMLERPSCSEITRSFATGNLVSFELEDVGSIRIVPDRYICEGAGYLHGIVSCDNPNVAIGDDFETYFADGYARITSASISGLY